MQALLKFLSLQVTTNFAVERKDTKQFYPVNISGPNQK